MNLKKRLIIYNGLTVVAPVIITSATAFMFLFLFSGIFNTHISYSSFKRLVSVRAEMILISDGLRRKIDEFENMSFQSKDKLDFKDYIKDYISNIQQTTYGEILILKKDNVLYTSLPFNKIDIQRLIDTTKENYITPTFQLENISYMLGNNLFRFKDGSEGQIIFMLPFGRELYAFTKFFITIGVVFIISFIGTNALVSYYLSKRIIKPVSNLKAAALRITGGNLDIEIIEEGDEELRALCKCFEEMRLKMLESIRTRLKYDEDRKLLVSSISHDLKTPITSIKGYVEGIFDGVANTPQKRVNYLRTIYSKALHIDSMIDDLLLFSKLDLNQVPFNFQKINMDEYLKDCIQECSDELLRSNITIALINESSKAHFAFIDIDRMKRVIINIIDNSRKYMNNDSGRIELILRESSLSVILEIRDNGAGILEEDLARIFDRFYRIDVSRNIASGSGLGLSIAKGIVESHGGKIWAVSRERQGLSIIMSLRRVE